MRSRYRLMRWATIVLSCIFLVGSGLVIVGAAPFLYSPHASQVGNEELTSSGSAASRPSLGAPQWVSVELPPLPPENHMLSSLGARNARYDNIMVDVKRDGTLHVLGEKMALDRFKSLLGRQIREQSQTVVTIRPDDNCPFRYVGSVISVCNEAGVSYQTKPRPVSIGMELKTGGPT